MPAWDPNVQNYWLLQQQLPLGLRSLLQEFGESFGSFAQKNYIPYLVNSKKFSYNRKEFTHSIKPIYKQLSPACAKPQERISDINAGILSSKLCLTILLSDQYPERKEKWSQSKVPIENE